MIFKCCEQIISGISLNHDGIKYCNEIWQGPEYILFEDSNAFYNNEKRRKEIIHNCSYGIFPENCKICPHLIEQEYNISNNEISKITIFNWDHCNAKCFYCSVSSKYFPNKKKSEYYDALPIIKELIKEKRITPNTFCAVQGGEPTMLEEFPLIIEELLKVNCRIEILSNGIEYNKCIVDVINAKNNNALCISLDCGSRDKYKRIKAVDKYDNVISNIKKYINETKDNEEKIRIKYIILPNINDTKKEIDNFFDICRDCNVISVAASINHSHNHFQNTKLKYRYSVLKTYEYFIKQAQKKGFNLVPEIWVDEAIKKENNELKSISLLEKIKAILHFHTK